MTKRISALLCAVLLAVGCAFPAFAGTKTYTIDEMNMTVEMPDDLYVFEREDFNLLAPHEDLEAAGFDDAEEQLQTMQDYGIYLTAVTKDKSMTINISKKQSSTTESVFDLSLLSDEEFEEFLDTMRSDEDEQDEEIKAYEISRYEGEAERPFFTLGLRMQGDTYGDVEEPCYVTLVNGFTITVDGVTEGDMTEEQDAILRAITASVHITEVLEKPTVELNAETLITLLFPIVLILVIIGALIVLRVRRKHYMKERAVLADKLTEYRKERRRLEQEAEESGVPMEEPPAVCRNKTAYTEEAAHAFVRFHFSHRKLLTMIGYGFVVLLILASVIFVDSEWYMRLIFFAAAVALVVWMCMIPGKLFNNVAATFKKARVKANEYTFREDDFRVSGIQSASLYPYFQITRAYETKKYFYLYFGEEQAYFVAKDGFTSGGADALRELLRRKLGKNFK